MPPARGRRTAPRPGWPDGGYGNVLSIASWRCLLPCDGEGPFCRQGGAAPIRSEPENPHRVLAPDRGAVGGCQLGRVGERALRVVHPVRPVGAEHHVVGADWPHCCLLYTSDAADERSSV